MAVEKCMYLRPGGEWAMKGESGRPNKVIRIERGAISAGLTLLRAKSAGQLATTVTALIFEAILFAVYDPAVWRVALWKKMMQGRYPLFRANRPKVRTDEPRLAGCRTPSSGRLCRPKSR